MISQTRLLTELSEVVKRSRLDGVSACAQLSRRQVFRFAHEAIHQGLTQERVTVTIKVVHDRRVGVASTEMLHPKSLTRCLRAAAEIAKHSPRQKPLPTLPAGHRIRVSHDYVPATARVSPATCVASLKRLFQIVRGAGAALAGSLVTGEDALAVVNSASVSCYTRSTIAGAKLVTFYRKLSGYASSAHRDFTHLDLTALLQRSLGQSLQRRDPVSLAPGTYEVILEPQAMADLMDWLAFIAFGAKSVEERTSFLTGRIGKQVMDRQVTLSDDGLDPRSLRMPFDYEGTPKCRVMLIDRGTAAGFVYDSTYGARFDHPSTGHGMLADDSEGPLPLHLAMAPGGSTVTQMIRACSRGLLIPRFHYVSGLLNPRTALMTGLTHEGTYLIEEGKPVAPVATMRFTQSLLEGLSHVRGISRERSLVADPGTSFSCALMPTVHLARFRFTGRSTER